MAAGLGVRSAANSSIGQQIRNTTPNGSQRLRPVPIQNLRAATTEPSRQILNPFHERSLSQVRYAETVGYHSKTASQACVHNVKIKPFQPNVTNSNLNKTSHTSQIQAALPMMPVIVDLRSLNPGVLAKQRMPSVPSGITIKRTTATAKDVSRHDEEVLPEVTIKKNSKVINPRIFFNMKEPITIINLDDDEDEYIEKDLIEVPIEYEPNEDSKVSLDNVEAMKDSKCSNKDNEIAIIDYSQDSSEKENDLPLFISNCSNKHELLNKNFEEKPIDHGKEENSKINEENNIRTESSLPTDTEEFVIYDDVKTIDYKIDINYYNDNFGKESGKKNISVAPSKFIDNEKSITDHITIIDESEDSENERNSNSYERAADVKTSNSDTNNELVNIPITNKLLDDTKNIEDKESKLANKENNTDPTVKHCEANNYSEKHHSKCKKMFENDESQESSSDKINIDETDRKYEPHKEQDNKNKINNKTYKKFLDLCLELDKTDDMKKIVDKKLINYYNSVDTDYTNSDEFYCLVKENMEKMIKDPERLFIYIREIANELRGRRAKHEMDKPNVQKSDTSGENDTVSKKIKKLEKTARILNKAIKKLQEQEVDFDEEDGSAYILEHRYKTRLVRVYKQLCILKGERGIKYNRNVAIVLSNISFENTRIPQVLTSLKIAASSRPRWFPDYLEILECVKRCATKAKMNLKDSEYESEARKIFVEIGSALQKRRQRVEYDDLCELMANCESDPAENDPVLAALLKQNHQLSKKNETEIINKYAEKETTIKRDRENDDSNSSNKNTEKGSSSISHKAKRFCTEKTEGEKCKEDQEIESEHVDSMKENCDSDIELITCKKTTQLKMSILKNVNSEKNCSSESDIIIIS